MHNNIMKLNNLAATILAASFALCSLNSCTKEGNSLFKGHYSFKTSGTIDVERTRTYSSQDPKVDTLQISLSTESGQMNILSENENTGEMIITMNVIGGDVIVYGATTSSDELSLTENKRAIKFTCENEIVSLNATVEGSAEKIDGVVIFDLKYTGETSVTPTTLSSLQKTDYKILNSSIKCVAKENK